MHIILYKHTSHYIHYQLSQNTHSQSQTVAIMTALKNSLILITLCLGLAAAQEDAGEARLLFSNYTSGISNTILWKTLLRGEFWNSENPRPPETDNSKLHHLRPGLPDSGWGSTRHRLWLPHHRVPHLPEPVPVTVQIIQWWWKIEKNKYIYMNMKFAFQSHQLTWDLFLVVTWTSLALWQRQSKFIKQLMTRMRNRFHIGTWNIVLLIVIFC